MTGKKCPNNIREARKAYGLTMKELGRRVGAAESSISQYETGRRQPDNEMLLKMAEELDTTVGYLLGAETKKAPAENGERSGEAGQIAAAYDKLDQWGKAMVREVVRLETERMEGEEEPEIPEAPARIVPLFGNSFAAGPGEPDFGRFWEDYEVPADSPAEFAIRITGDSMEPWLPDGSIQLCKKTTPQDGEVGAFLIDGEFLCKQVCLDITGTLHLFSLNRERRDMDRHIPRDELDRVRCFGSVIMRRVPLPLD